MLLKSASSSQIKSICIALRRVERVKLFSPGILQDSPLRVEVLGCKKSKTWKNEKEL